MNQQTMQRLLIAILLTASLPSASAMEVEGAGPVVTAITALSRELNGVAFNPASCAVPLANLSNANRETITQEDCEVIVAVGMHLAGVGHELAAQLNERLERLESLRRGPAAEDGEAMQLDINGEEPEDEPAADEEPVGLDIGIIAVRQDIDRTVKTLAVVRTNISQCLAILLEKAPDAIFAVRSALQVLFAVINETGTVQRLLAQPAFVTSVVFHLGTAGKFCEIQEGDETRAQDPAAAERRHLAGQLFQEFFPRALLALDSAIDQAFQRAQNPEEAAFDARVGAAPTIISLLACYDSMPDLLRAKVAPTWLAAAEADAAEHGTSSAFATNEQRLGIKEGLLVRSQTAIERVAGLLRDLP